MPADPKQILSRLDALKTAASTHFKLCDDMAKYIAPSRVGITSEMVLFIPVAFFTESCACDRARV